MILRITSGIKKGAILFVSEDLSIRPTTDKVKQSIFNMIQFDVKDREVLDLFSGSGALGIEAISRGANCCTFVDTNIFVTNKNIEKLNFQEKATITKADFCDFLTKCKNKFSLVFLDPPYNKGHIDTALKLLIRGDLLKTDAIIVMECDVTESVFVPTEIEIFKNVAYGRVKVMIGRRI